MSESDSQVAAEPEALWIDAEKDYQLALQGGKLVSRNPKGKQLASVPKWLKDSEAAQQLIALSDWLAEHEVECRETTEAWMLRSLPVPRDILQAVWEDAAWQQVLTNLVVWPWSKSEPEQERAGFLRGVDAAKGIGIVDLDGETQWLKVSRIAIPHPILLAELGEFRQLAAELEFQQVIDQLFRQTWQPDPKLADETRIDQFSSGKFEMLTHVLGLCRRLGYRVRGGSACCPVWESGALVEARYWVGAEYPEAETYTGDLVFTDAQERALPIRDVGPVAFSEGMRMAAAIYAKRVVEKEGEDN